MIPKGKYICLQPQGQRNNMESSLKSPVRRRSTLPVLQYPTLPGCCSRSHRKTLTSCGSRDNPSDTEPENLQFEREKTDVHRSTHHILELSDKSSHHINTRMATNDLKSMQEQKPQEINRSLEKKSKYRQMNKQNNSQKKSTH